MLRAKKYSTAAILNAAATAVLFSFSCSSRADIIADTFPANNQGNLALNAGQTFTTGVLTTPTLSRIELEGPLDGATGPYTLQLYTDTDGDHATWDPGTLLGSSTRRSLAIGGGILTAFDFPTLPALSNNAVYAFTFADAAGTPIGARVAVTNIVSETLADGSVFSNSLVAFNGAFDTAMRITTGAAMSYLELTIDRATGNVTLANPSGALFPNITGYSIFSSAGALSQAQWNKQSVGASQLANDNDAWTTLTTAGVTTELSEAVLATGGDGNGGDLAATTGALSFGNIWRQGTFEDLTMEIAINNGTPEGLILRSGVDFGVTYVGAPIDPADLDGNGVVNALDWVEFKQGYGTDLSGMTAFDAYHSGDINSDGVSNMNDFVAYRALFNSAAGEGALQAIIASVPEPSTACLAILGAIALVRRRSLSMVSRHARLMMLAVLAVLSASVASSIAKAELLVPIFSDDFESYTVGDPADFTTGADNWVHNGAGTAPNTSRFFNSANFVPTGTTRLWIANAANAAAGSGINSKNGITLESNTDYLFRAAMVAETFDPARMGTGTYDLKVGSTLEAATSIIGGPQSFTARGDDAPGGESTYDDQYTLHSFNSGTVGGSDKLFISIAFNGTDATNPFVGVDNVSVNLTADIGLRVNTTTGNVTMYGDPSIAFDIASYSLTSALGQLAPTNFASLESQGVGDPAKTPDDGIGFEVLGTPDANEFAEADLTGSSEWNNSTNYSLGQIFNTATLPENRDVAISFTTPAGETLIGSVQYIGGSLLGDYNLDGTVDAADYTVWRDNNINGEQGYIDWKSNFGATSGSGAGIGAASAVPESTSAVLLLLGAALAGAWTRSDRRSEKTWMTFVDSRKKTSVLLAAVAAALFVSATTFASQTDRSYTLGDDAAEEAAADAIVGSAAGALSFDSAGAPGDGDLQDLNVVGSPFYRNVSSRPGATGSSLGAEFNGAGDALYTPISMNAPAQMWDNATFFPSGFIFPHNYEGILSHGMQLWAKPNPSAVGTSVQTLAYDTAQHGVGITATGSWSLLHGAAVVDSGVGVSGTLNPGGWVHVMELSGFGSLARGNSATGGALLVNGVAVATRAAGYNTGAATGATAAVNQLVLGADPVGAVVAEFENYYNGILDNVELFFWGNNSNQLGADLSVGGTNNDVGDLDADGKNWGALNLNVDNAWIASELERLQALAGAASIPDTDLNFDGQISDADATIFVTNWRAQNIISGVRIGDWNSRKEGDFNYDGITDLRDALMLNHDLMTATGAGLDFSALGAGSVPEPTTFALLILGALAVAGTRSRHR